VSETSLTEDQDVDDALVVDGVFNGMMKELVGGLTRDVLFKF
jgi:hypothetical protein